MRRIRSRVRVAVALALRLAFVAHAGATAMYDYKPGEFLAIDGGTSPDKTFNAEEECELVPGDKTRVVSTQPC